MVIYNSVQSFAIMKNETSFLLPWLGYQVKNSVFAKWFCGLFSWVLEMAIFVLSQFRNYIRRIEGSSVTTPRKMFSIKLIQKNLSSSINTFYGYFYFLWLLVGLHGSRRYSLPWILFLIMFKRLPSIGIMTSLYPKLIFTACQ